MFSNTGLFKETNEDLYSKHLPNTLYRKLVSIDLINKKQVSFPLNDGKTVEFKLTEELNPNSIYPDTVSISITRTFPSITDKPVSLNTVYCFTNKNALQSYSGEVKKQNSNYNFMALLGSDNLLSQSQTEEFTNKIIGEINKARLNPPKQDLDCACRIF